LLDTLGLPSAIGQLVAEFEQRSGLKIDYRNSLGDTLLNDGQAVALFRILQEALTNIERHAQATRVRISLDGMAQRVRLRVRDDGIGFSPKQLDKLNDGIGLRNIRERVEHFGGRFALNSEPGQTELMVTLPSRGTSPSRLEQPT
jgi:two-component system NarL family sensor kinase